MTGEPIFSEWKVDTPLEQVIGEAVGAASTCWESLDNTGVFQSEYASQIVDAVVANVRLKLFFVGEDDNPNLPNLGLATTRELLTELKARAEVSLSVGEYPGPMNNVAIIAENLLTGIPEPMLNYRTVDGG